MTVDTALGVTITFLGCGSMGTAILSGLLNHLAKSRPPTSSSASDKLIVGDSRAPDVSVRAINACVRTSESAASLRKTVSAFEFPVDVSYDANLAAIEPAHIVLLGCLPEQVDECLGVPCMSNALRGKILISVVAGMSEENLGNIVLAGDRQNAPTHHVNDNQHGVQEPLLSPTVLSDLSCIIIRAMPNTAALVHQSITLIAEQDPPAPARAMMLVEWLFAQIGEVTRIPARQLDVATSLCSSGPAFVALYIEGLVDGAVALGLKRQHAVKMAAQMIKGSADLVLGGRSLAGVMEEIATPGGSTMVGLLTLEEGGVRARAARTIMESTKALQRMASA